MSGNTTTLTRQRAVEFDASSKLRMWLLLRPSSWSAAQTRPEWFLQCRATLFFQQCACACKLQHFIAEHQDKMASSPLHTVDVVDFKCQTRLAAFHA